MYCKIEELRAGTITIILASHWNRASITSESNLGGLKVTSAFGILHRGKCILGKIFHDVFEFYSLP